MAFPGETGGDYDVVVQAQPSGCDWTVVCADRRILTGQAANPADARRAGDFAAAALQALARIGRRRF